MEQVTYMNYIGNLQKIFKVILILTLLLLLLCSCDFGHRNSITNQSQTEIYAIAYYNIPFATCSNFDKAEVVETDIYGRQLIAYKSHRSWTLDDYIDADETDSYIFAYVIVQKSNDKFVWFYDDYCYIFTKKYNIAETLELDAFKELNDWNEETDEKKMTKVTNSFEQSLEISENKYILPISIFLKKEYMYNENCVIDRFCTSKEGQLLVFREIEKNENQCVTYGDAYLFFLDWNNSIIDYELLLEPIYACQDQVHKFKERNQITAEKYNG